MATNFSDRLLLLPLFEGFSRLDVMDMVEKTPFSFLTIKPGEVFVKQDDECFNLAFVLQGKAKVSLKNEARAYEFIETVQAPWVLEPERLFGLHNRYTRTVEAVTELHLLLLDKKSVNFLLHSSVIFQMNFLNRISATAQYAQHVGNVSISSNIETRFRNFLLCCSLHPIGPKELRMHMTDLALELGTTRIVVSRMLKELRLCGKLTHSRGITKIKLLESL